MATASPADTLGGGLLGKLATPPRNPLLSSPHALSGQEAGATITCERPAGRSLTDSEHVQARRTHGPAYEHQCACTVPISRQLTAGAPLPSNHSSLGRNSSEPAACPAPIDRKPPSPPPAVSRSDKVVSPCVHTTSLAEARPSPCERALPRVVSPGLLAAADMRSLLRPHACPGQARPRLTTRQAPTIARASTDGQVTMCVWEPVESRAHVRSRPKHRSCCRKACRAAAFQQLGPATAGLQRAARQSSKPRSTGAHRPPIAT